jgi:SAM-dependent methyltransferase
MVHYYSSTTLRDYQLLAWYTGSTAMHTSLELDRPSPFPSCGPLRQVLHVLAHLPTARLGTPTRILEVGFGKGANAIFLAQLLQAARVEGVDVVPEHLEYATRAAARCGAPNARFRLADATQPGALRAAGAPALDLIYGIEAFCYLDTDARLAAFLDQAAAALAPDGRIVVVDGFRADDFAALPEPVQQAMNLAERAWRMRRMTSVGSWKRLAARAGFQLVAEQDLTAEALPFWLHSWRVAQAALWARPLLRSFFACPGWPRETAGNFVACLMFAYALALGSAKYGVLVFAKGE